MAKVLLVSFRYSLVTGAFPHRFARSLKFGRNKQKRANEKGINDGRLPLYKLLSQRAEQHGTRTQFLANSEVPACVSRMSASVKL